MKNCGKKFSLKMNQNDTERPLLAASHSCVTESQNMQEFGVWEVLLYFQSTNWSIIRDRTTLLTLHASFHYQQIII